MDLINKTRLKFVASKIASGINNVPDWQDNDPIGYAKTGVPIFDDVSFSLTDNFDFFTRSVSNDFYIDEFGVKQYINPNFSNSNDILGAYTNCTITIANSANVSRTFINGRKGGSVKQITSPGDYEITFNINIFSDYSNLNQPEGTLNEVGYNFGKPQRAFGNYYPNMELEKINTFFNKFYTNVTLEDVKVKSNYLNNNFGIMKIIPYSFNTMQNHDYTNTYNLIINAYSQFDDDSGKNEIIP